MRVLCWLAVLSYVVFCEAEEEEPLQYCKTVCRQNCTKCEEQITCDDETQNNCGLGEPDPRFGGVCVAHYICVPKENHCPCYNEHGEEYPLTTIVHCTNEELLCPGKSPGNGCPGQDVCVPKGKHTTGTTPGQLCDGYCPVDCNPDTENHCPLPPNSVGCAIAPICIPKSTDNNDKFCPNQHCPVVCKEDEFHCSGKTDGSGCKDTDICTTRGTSKSGGLCPGTCPVECYPNTEIKCHGQVDPTTGCTGSDVCHAKARDVNGEYCPDESYSHGCEIKCLEDEILCPAKMTVLGCQEKATCFKKQKDNNDEDCPDTSACPTICQPNEVSCPGGKDENGCKKPDLCIPQERDYDGDLCPVHCPGICADNTVLCHGHKNSKGCETPDTCEPRGTKTKGNDIGGQCPGYCPKECKHHEVKCVSQWDCDGCKTEEICRPKAKNKNGEFCPDDSASHDCPKECDETSGEVLCPSYENALGCKPRDFCFKRPTYSEDPEEFCPSHSICIHQCEPDEMLCPDGTDSRGCKNADLCIPRGKNKNGDLCPEWCPPKCTDAQYFCAGAIRNNGCKRRSRCVDRKLDDNGVECPEVCPVFCKEKELKVEGKTDARGCLEQDTCIDNVCYEFDIDYLGNDINHCDKHTKTSQECQDLCKTNDDCLYFTWIGVALHDLEENKNKCCLKTSSSGKCTSNGLVSGPKQCG